MLSQLFPEVKLTVEEWVFYLWDRGHTITYISNFVLRHPVWVFNLLKKAGEFK